jgi:hypothetical protein
MTDPDLFSKILRFVKHEEELVKAAEEELDDEDELEDKRVPKEVVDDFSESVSYDYDASEEPYISFGVSGLLASTQKLLNVNKGIQSSDSITEDMQAVHPGQFGFLSGLEGPECFPPDTEVLTSEGWIKFKDATKDHEFCCLGSGFCRHFSKPYAIIESAFKGNLIKFTDANGGELLVTPNHRIYHTLKNDRFAHDVRIYLAKELKSANFYTFTELYLEAGIALSVMYVDKAEEVPYDGEVYCASVPGSSVLVRTPQGSTWWTGNSERIGVDARLTKGVKIGSDGRLYQLFLNKKTGNYEYLNPEQVANRIVKLPD